MKTSTVELKKAIDSLVTALDLYQDNQNQSDEMQKALRDACIQRFEYSIELCWKISMKMLGSTTAAAKPAIREMARNNLIPNPELWLQFIEHRNNTSHAYDEDVAKSVFSIIKSFAKEAAKLCINLEHLK